ncbi:MAG: AbrB/MazE/SpoVT family DNA-binding domain-containing protein [Candidatus Peribacteraceae bacterium]|nr:AbrB/MazE/SpoVT family DNA-binding domain-containing protein [Candidatus Peribacteraceae bacterium]
MTQLGHSKISSKSQITIPKKVQEELGDIETGQYIIFIKEGKKIYITKGTVNPVD